MTLADRTEDTAPSERRARTGHTTGRAASPSPMESSVTRERPYLKGDLWARGWTTGHAEGIKDVRAAVVRLSHGEEAVYVRDVIDLLDTLRIIR